MPLLLYIFVVFFTVDSAWADQSDISLDPGQTMLNISAFEEIEVEQDQLTARLRVEIKGENPIYVQDKINKLMQSVIHRGQKTKDIDIQTGNYNIYQNSEWVPIGFKGPEFEPCPHKRRNSADCKQTKIWNGHQTISLKSIKNTDGLLKLVGDFQSNGLLMSNLSYSLSRQRQRDIRDNLMEAAIQKLRVRARRAAKALDKKSVHLVQISIDAPHQPITPIYHSRAATLESASLDMVQSAAPVAQGGETRVHLKVHATAIIE